MKRLSSSCAMRHITALLAGILCHTLLYAQPKPVSFSVTVLRTDSLPQQGVILRINGMNERYTSDAKGVIRFDSPTDGGPDRTASLYFPSEPDTPVASFSLRPDETRRTFFLDSPDDLKMFRQTGKTFEIEGIVQHNNGTPITGAVVSIQGTGRKTETDEIGLFRILADYNHPVTVRAPGMENRSLDLNLFLQHPEEPYKVVLYARSSTHVYTSARQMPEYPGGMQAFMNYLKHRLKYPTQARKEKREGMVIVQFIVEKDGSVTAPTIVRPLAADLDSAALTAIRNMPRWIPARDNGTIVRCRYSVPVQFKLDPPADDSRKPSATAAALRLQDSLKAERQKTDSLRHLIPAAGRQPALPVPPATQALPDAHAGSLTLPALTQSQPQTSGIQIRKRHGNIFVRFFHRLFGRKEMEE